ncbi:A24 family peptidase [Actinomyces oricola]|uniref:hypothetical protein n=1 Tax=Actinomyces oricola TaxID=206043 RepID=UPI000FFF0CDE|nr:hypothetical protein [Actinomyces oricola]
METLQPSPLLITGFVVWVLVALSAVYWAREYVASLPEEVPRIRHWPLTFRTALLFTIVFGLATVVVSVFHTGSSPSALVLGLVVFLVPACLTDLVCHRLPNVLLAGAAAWGTLCAAFSLFQTWVVRGLVNSLGGGSVPHSTGEELMEWLKAVGGLLWPAAVIGTIMLALVLVRAGLGLGDAKLAVITSLWLTTISWQAPFVGLFLGLVLAGLPSLALIILGRANLRTLIPLGPALTLGAWLTWAGGLRA